MSMTITEKQLEIVAQLYAAYGSDSGYLFGIPPHLRPAVEAIVEVILEWESGRDEPDPTEDLPGKGYLFPAGE